MKNIILTVSSRHQWQSTLTSLEKAGWKWASGAKPTSIYYDLYDDARDNFAVLYLNPKVKSISRLFNAYAFCDDRKYSVHII